jgi:NitT/TauT family transport system ATP-binding protein
MSVPVSLRHVRKTFVSNSGSVNACGPIDLEIQSSRSVSFVGPSGCGKSTLLLMIAGLMSRSTGDIVVNDRIVDRPLTDVGIVFQGHALVDWRTALDNVLLQIELRKLRRRDYEEKARILLNSVGLGDFLHRYPYELSGGMQQRTAFCRALIHEPSLILLDEPLGALDAMTREVVRGDLERLWMTTRPTMILVTHSIEEAVQLADDIIVITPRPGIISRRIAVDLPRPRGHEVRQSRVFAELVTEIREIFMNYGVL